MHLIEG